MSSNESQKNISNPYSFSSDIQSHSENTKRIAKNTLTLYVRMLFSMLVSLYTSRVVLNTLGVEDYGIYNVVGGVVAMFSLISSALSSSTSRFLTFELGRKDLIALRKVFSTAILIHLALAAIVLILAETAGLWFLNTQMTIPPERMGAANWVYQISVLTFLIALFNTPYNASVISHEKMGVYAYIGMIDVILRLGAVLFLAYGGFCVDKLVTYSILLFVVWILIQAITLTYCFRNFEECRTVRPGFDRTYWRQMSSFAVWNFIGCTAALLKDNGVNILLNIFFGPVVNAARGIALSVNNAVTSFSGNFMTALNPQITKSYASGDHQYMMSLVERGSRFSFYIMLILALPIIFETDFILTVWLKQYPEHTVNFVRLVLILSLIDILSNTLITLQLATGKIRNYQIAVGGMLLMNFPVSYLCLKLGMAPEYTLIVAIAVSICCLILRLIFLRKMAGLSIMRYVKNVCMNISSVTIAASVIPMAIYLAIENDSPIKFIIVTVSSVISSIISVYMIGCSSSERQFIYQKVSLYFRRRSLKQHE